MIRKTLLMEFNYNPVIDVLQVKMPDFSKSHSSEIEEDFQEMRETIKTYFVKRLLIDSAATNKIPDKDQLQWEIKQFMIALSGTLVSRVARVRSKNTERENKIEQLTRTINPAYFQNIKYQNFDSEIQAINWLTERTGFPNMN